MKQLHIIISDSYTARLKRNKYKLIKCLDVDSGLNHEMCSEDVLTDEESNELLVCKNYMDQNNQFYQILMIKLKDNENCYVKFREALLVTDQEHVDNLLEGMVWNKL